MPDQIEAWITGIGLASSLGEGLDANWQALNERRVNVDTSFCPPHIIHPLVPVNFDTQIPKKGDQRQMEDWQRIGTYAAGLALDSAGVKGDAAILSRMDMIVAAAGGERDTTVDSAILTSIARGEKSSSFINDRLMNGLRPTLFLAQLSNLMAGNISIVHGVTGSSRTFMGEEEAGVDAARIALARIHAGQSDIALVGAAHNAARKEMLMLYEFGNFNLKNEYKPVWQRAEHPGFALGSAGVFLVIESAKHARARGAKPFARLAAVASDQSRRKNAGDIAASLSRLWSAVAPSAGNNAAILSGACGAAAPTQEERAFLEQHRDYPVRATHTAFGHTMEASFLINLALGALCLSRGNVFAANDPSGFEFEASGKPSQIIVSSVGHWRGEGMARLEALDA